MNKVAVLIVLFAAVFAASYATDKQKVANADVEKLIAAGVGDEVILNLIAAGEPSFDTSPDALIALKQKGASPAVLAAITSHRPSAMSTPAPSETAFANPESAAQAEAGNFVDVILVDGERRTVMSYSTPDTRTAGRWIPVYTGGNREYWVLHGAHAQLRVQNRNPSFLASVARNSHPDESINLARWEPRRNETREIMIAIARPDFRDSVTTTSHMTFPKDRVIPLQYVKSKYQPPVQASIAQYEVRPLAPLAPGEYTLQVSGRIYDFGVD